MSRRRRRPVRLLPPPRRGPVEESGAAAARPHTAARELHGTFPPADPEQTAGLVLYDPDRPRVPTIEELVASARLTWHGIRELNAGLLDEPDRRGGIRYGEGDDAIPVRIAEDESPLDLARETQRRRERARREATQARAELASLVEEVKRREDEWRATP